jgi:hypothetical protein
MPEPPEERSPADLLLEAVEHLAPEDQKRVLAWLLNRGHLWPQTQVALHTIRTEPVSVLPALSTMEAEALMVRSVALRGEHQTVPVRLPTDQYRRLRDWCQEQGFSMATVIRGLVARFLEQRGTPPGAPG